MNLSTLFFAFAVAFAVLAAVLLVIQVGLRRARRSGEATVAEHFSPEDIRLSDPVANFFGLTVGRARQLRGNGSLVLTPGTLWFQLVGATVPVEIPVDQIRAVSLVRSHNGRSARHDLLRVEFDGDEGPDVAAWDVEHPSRWVAALQ